MVKTRERETEMAATKSISKGSKAPLLSSDYSSLNDEDIDKQQFP